MTWRHYAQSSGINLIVDIESSPEWITLGEGLIRLHPLKAAREMTDDEIDLMEEWKQVQAKTEPT